MEKKEKVIVNIKQYYCIHDIVADDYSDMWTATNSASALRCFRHTIATQFKQGAITNPDDYELYYVGEAVTYDNGFFNFYPEVHRVIDNEANNKEDGTEVIVNNVQ